MRYDWKCTECGELDSVSYRYDKYYIEYRCYECEYSWEEDQVIRERVYKSVGYDNLYVNQAKARALYEKHHGPIPGRWHLHHIDHDPTNQDISNLIAVPPDVHNLIHANPRAYGCKSAIQAVLRK